MNINTPENLMKNVEHKLRKHVENKRKRLRIYAVAAVLIIAVILPFSAYAYNKYRDIPFKQEVDLARQNNSISKLNKTFKYKNIDFNIKEAIADETGIEIIYEVSNPKYCIDGLSFGDSKGNRFKIGGYSLPDPNLKQKEKAFYIHIGEDAVEYMKCNPITLKIDKVSYKNEEDNKLWSKFISFVGIKNDSFEVEWKLKMQLTMQEVKTIPINKEFETNIGTLKIKSLKEGILKTIIEYDFVKSDKNISNIRPIFSIRLDKEYTSNIGTDAIRERSYYLKGEEFKSIYYKEVNEIGIRLIGMNVDYWYNDTKEYEVFKDKLPMEFDFNGDKFKIVSMLEKDDSIEYEVQYSKTNKIYNYIDIAFKDEGGSSYKNDNVKFKDQDSQDKIYSSLLKKVPDLNSICNASGHLGEGMDKAQVSEKVNSKSKNDTTFTINAASRSFLYDTDEIVIKH